MKSVLVIPVFNPTKLFIQTLEDLNSKPSLAALTKIVINDGSTQNVELFNHEILKSNNIVLLNQVPNKGKGAAIKLAIDYIQTNEPDADAVITVDADAQHQSLDVEKLFQFKAEDKNSLVIGTREFTFDKVPLRSYLGNQITRYLIYFFKGGLLEDTQSGLRRYPKSLFSLMLGIENNRYEFEMDVLLSAIQMHTKIETVAVSTRYIEQNKSSHFNPIIDSTRIYYVLIRYILSSFSAAVIDSLLFAVFVYFDMPIFVSHFTSRTIGGSFNFFTNRKIVFKSKATVLVSLFEYFLLLYFSGTCTYLILNYLHDYFAIQLYAAKIMSELFLFISNFLIQHIFIFKTKSRDK